LILYKERKTMNSLKPKNVILIFLAFVAVLMTIISVSVVRASGGQAASQVQLLAITPTPMRTDAFTFCAFKGGTCTVPGTKSVRYGTSTSFVVKTVTNSIPCTDAAFGVLLNKLPKDCRYITMPVPSEAKWTSCAIEDQTCVVNNGPTPTPKLVRYGANNAYVYQVVSSLNIICSDQAFGSDPIPSAVKECLFIDLPTVGGTIWTQCAIEGGQCSSGSNGARTVAYGYAPAAAFNYKTLTSSFPIACTAAVFSGDPYPSAAKTCYVAPSEWTTGGWLLCANDGGTCNVQGTKTVAYGEGTTFTYKNVTGSISCRSSSFGVASSSTPRACYYNRTFGE
jgi:hypothetical protein